MKRTLLALLAATTACRAITGTPSRAAAGTWVLEEYHGRPLPAFYELAGSDSLFLIADTLTLHGNGTYARVSHLVYAPNVDGIIAPVQRVGGYDARGDQVLLYSICDAVTCAPSPEVGRRLARTLVFPADTATPLALYRR